MVKKSYIHNPKLRKLAEEKLHGQEEVFNQNDLTSDDTIHLLHELQVHQIELEMQNEELRSSQSELSEAREKYYDLYNFAPVGYLTLFESDLIKEANLTASKLLGIERKTLETLPITKFVANEDQDIYYFHHNALFNTGKLQQSELRMKRVDGTIFWVSIASSITEDKTGTKFNNIIITDINPRKKLKKI